MFNKLLSIIILLGFINIHQLSAANFTLNATEDSGSSYPFFYNGSFGNGEFLNYIALINYIGPFIAMGSTAANVYIIKKIDKNMALDIEKIIDNIADSREKILEFLVHIIIKFNNGINIEDEEMIRGMIDKLNSNERKCQHCFANFATMVSDNNDDILADKIRNYFNKQEKPMCHGHERNGVAGQDNIKKSFKTKAKDCCCSFTAPCSWLNYVIGAGICGLSYALTPEFPNTKHAAGSTFGDMANMVNAFSIPWAGFIPSLQYYLQRNKIKQERLDQAVIKALENLNTVIELTAQIVAKMDNDINYEEARDILTALVLLGWPEDLVNKFIENASTKTESEDTQNLLNDIKAAFKVYKIKYEINLKNINSDDDSDDDVIVSDPTSDVNDDVLNNL